MAGIAPDKICPIITEDTDYPERCQDKCEWNDGEGCAVWRIVKALDRIAVYVDMTQTQLSIAARKG